MKTLLTKENKMKTLLISIMAFSMIAVAPASAGKRDARDIKTNITNLDYGCCSIGSKNSLLLGSGKGTFITRYEKGLLDGEIVYWPSADNENHTFKLKLRVDPGVYETDQIPTPNSAFALVRIKNGWMHGYLDTGGYYELESSLKITKTKKPKGFSVKSKSHAKNKLFFTTLNSILELMNTTVYLEAYNELTPTDKYYYDADNPKTVTKSSFKCKWMDADLDELKCKTKMKFKTVLEPQN